MKRIFAAALIAAPLMLGACTSIDLGEPTDKAPSQLRAERAERRAAKHTYNVTPGVAGEYKRHQAEQALGDLATMSEAGW
jgi:hypothetical protein